jgi:LysR family transcriptional regulator, hydrogen peroxide-inducible genes activator
MTTSILLRRRAPPGRRGEPGETIMTLQELRYVVALADKGHFVRAAEACHVGQPTLSMQLKKLEDYLGVLLFDRNKHHLRPTPVGEAIIEQARIALGVVDQIRQIAHRGQDPMNRPLRLGVIPTLGPYLIPHVLPPIRRGFPQLALYLREDLTGPLLERLRQGRLDALLLAIPVRGDDVDVLPLFFEEFVVALPNGHALTSKPQIDEHDLVREDLLLLEEGHCLRDQALAICHSRVSEQREELEATSIETLRHMVAAGAGCTLLPVLATSLGAGGMHDGLVTVRTLAPPAPTRTIGLVWRHHFPGEALVRRLGELVVEHLPRVAGVMPITGNLPGSLRTPPAERAGAADAAAAGS